MSKTPIKDALLGNASYLPMLEMENTRIFLGEDDPQSEDRYLVGDRVWIRIHTRQRLFHKERTNFVTQLAKPPESRKKRSDDRVPSIVREEA